MCGGGGEGGGAAGVVCVDLFVRVGKYRSELFDVVSSIFPPPPQDSPLILQSDRNVTVNARNDQGQLTGQLTVGKARTHTHTHFHVLVHVLVAKMIFDKQP